MDRSAAMPRTAWVEIRDADGELLVSIPARITGGTISADLPAFPPNTPGTIELCTEEAGNVERDRWNEGDLPSEPRIMLAEMG